MKRSLTIVECTPEYRQQDLLLRRLYAARRALGRSQTEWAKNFHFKIVKHLRRQVARQELAA